MNDFSVIKVKVTFTSNRDQKSHIWGDTLYSPTIDETWEKFKEKRYSEWHRNNGQITAEIVQGYHGEEAKEMWFRHLCETHDLTYDYSDDGSVWRRGGQSLAGLKSFSSCLPRDVAVKIWNEIVDTKMQPSAREYFYWKI